LPTILNINPVATSVQQPVGQLTQPGTALTGDILHQGAAGVSLIKDQLRSVINIARKWPKQGGIGSGASCRCLVDSI